MKKYEISLALSLISAILLFLGTFDGEGFLLLIIFPVVIILGFISIFLKLSSGVLFRNGYWDILSFLVWFIVISGYGSFAYSRFSAGDVIWYQNTMFANQIITAVLLFFIVSISIFVSLKKEKSKI
jgi:hypothetical protein